MTRLKHYHLGCGESLQCSQAELQRMHERKNFIVREYKSITQAKLKRAKQH